MSRKFELTTDSTCDLYADEYISLDVHVGKLNYTLEKDNKINEYLDDFKCYQDYVDFYNLLRSGYVARTTILNLQAHVDLFTEMAKKGVKNLLHISQSDGLSPTVDNARKAIEIVKEDYPDIDYIALECKTTTIGEGMMVRYAVEMRDNGFTKEEARQAIEDIKLNIQHDIIVNDLMYLKRGGRVSGASAAIGSMLQLKPITIFDNNGKLQVVRKEMGIKKAFKSVIEDFKKYPANTKWFKIQIVHTDNLEGAKTLQQLFIDNFGITPDIRIMGPIIGAHVGPGALAVGWTSNCKRPL